MEGDMQVPTISGHFPNIDHLGKLSRVVAY